MQLACHGGNGVRVWRMSLKITDLENGAAEKASRCATIFGGLQEFFRGPAYDMWWSVRLMPSFSIRCRKVLGCKLRILAAPFAPSMTPELNLKASRI